MSSLVSYEDDGNCGPRGDDANADLGQCNSGSEVVKEVQNDGYNVVAQINGCKYFAYTTHKCTEPAAPFDPTSSLVSYTDDGNCGPRGDDANADLGQCNFGSEVVKEVQNDGYNVVAQINGCKYFAYTTYKCKDPPAAGTRVSVARI